MAILRAPQRETGGDNAGTIQDPEKILRLLSGATRMPATVANAAASGVNTATGAKKSGGGGGGTISPLGSVGSAAGSTAAKAGTTAGNGPYLQAGADTFAKNPEAMLADLLYQQYGDTNSWNGLYEMLKPYADAANVLFLAQRGQDAEGGSKEDFLGYLEDYWNALQTPGQFIDWQSALGNVLNPAQNSPLASFLALGSPEEQAANFMSLLAGITETSFHPLFARSMMDRVGHEADRFLGQSARGPVDPFYQFFQEALPYAPRLLPGAK